ncbi:MAG: hypothetical protein EXX96DRAFT_339169 [Benjaminiella poitrasii]|nr:MAG: hypothetical protein EXX96DRAFT_339169 [Benjaminiella poitrasii]
MNEEEIEQLLTLENLTPELQSLIEDYKQLKAQEEQALTQTSEQVFTFSVGARCAIPFSQDELMFLLPALILSYNDDNTMAQVLILTPVTKETMPCNDYFGSQEYCTTTDQCQFHRSHGYAIPTEFLTSFDALETDCFQYKQRIWYQKDEIWQLGQIIDEIMSDDGTICWRVNNQQKGQQTIVDREHIIPYKSLLDDETPSDNEEAYSSDASEDHHVAKSVVDTGFGHWQAHTTGFAAKMMQKMGYVHGQGLGAQGQGRIEPVEANKVYTSQHHGNRSGLGSVSQKAISKKKTKEKTKAKQEERDEEVDMFNLMNTLLEGNSDKAKDKSPAKAVKTLNTKQANQTIAKLQSKLDIAQSDYVHAKEALRRNTGSSLEGQFRTKLKNATHILETLNNEMSGLQRHVKRTKEQQEMYTF